MKYLYIIFVVILSACQSAPDRDVKSPDTAQARESSDKKPPAVPEEPIIKEPEPTVSKRQDRFVGKTVTGTKFIVEKVKNEEDERHYVLNGEGFKFAKAVNLPNHAPVKDLLTADLDGDGFGEAYIVYDCLENGEARPVIVAFVSYKDRAFGPIYVRAASAKMLQGYHGKDRIYLEDGQLFREFPIEGDNGMPGLRKIAYHLTAAETGFVLEGQVL